MELQRLEKNLAANEAYVKINYPGENFISEISEIQAAKKYTKGLIIPENVNETEHRIKLVLDRHPEFTGKIVISWRGGRPHFWDTNNFR